MRAISAGQPLRDSANHHWVHKLARAGFAAKGVVYFLVGTLALQAAFSGGKPQGKEGATREIGNLPFGDALLVVTGIGLLGYALWRVIGAAFDPDHEGVLHRIAHVVSSVVHGSLGVAALQLGLGQGSGPGESSNWISKVMAEPLGAVAVAIAGIGVLGFAAEQLIQAVTGRIRELKFLRMSYRQREWAVRLGRLGLGARGVVFGIIATFLIKAGIETNPGKAKGMGEALQQLQAEPSGGLLLGLVAIGLACYGGFMLFCARFRHLPRV
ncbi:MAG TPA: DUF1206 domain-containing protein [Polyangiaceae bacterium]|nr:DUF1206 domain-containing protein [Polyangiaceae bacterium]